MVCIVLAPHFITFHLISTSTTRPGNGVFKMRGSLLHYSHQDLHSPGHVAKVSEDIVSRHTDIHTTRIFSSSTLPHLIRCVSTWYLSLHDLGGLSVVRQSTTIRLHRYRVRPCLRAEYTRTVMTSIRGGSQVDSRHCHRDSCPLSSVCAPARFDINRNTSQW